MEFIKYPKTYHLEGSNNFKPSHKNTISFNQLKEHYIVLEEKVDGANSAISFDENGVLKLQSRGHYLNGGPREKFFSFFKQWANEHYVLLKDLLGKRYVMFGEYMFAKHTIFYNNLPSYFLEFDIYDRELNEFLSTKKRKELLKDHTYIHSVPILWEGEGSLLTYDKLINNVSFSKYIDPFTYIESLKDESLRLNISLPKIIEQTDVSMHMEGLYIKMESSFYDIVTKRAKWVRPLFLKVVFDNDDHWFDRPIMKNKLENESVLSP